MRNRTVTVSIVLALLTGSLSFGQVISGDIAGTFDEVYHAHPYVLPHSDVVGLGTDSLSLRPQADDQVPTTLAFAGNSVAAAVGETFVLGTLTFHNGDWWYSLDDPALNLTTVTFTAQSSSAGNPSFTAAIGLYTTPDNLTSVDLEADFLYFIDHPELGSFRVYEDTSATIEILGAFGSLDLVGFGDVIEGADNAYWNTSVEATPNLVPVPGAVLLVSLGSGAVAFCRRRRVL